MSHPKASPSEIGLLMASAGLVKTADEAGPLYPQAGPPFLYLARAGKPEAVVVAPAGSPIEARHAARELVAYVQRMSGARLRVVRKTPKGPAVILRIAPGLNPPPEGKREWAGSRGYRLHVRGNKLCVTGSDALGVLQGVYGLLERHLGVRWLWPGKLGEIVPRRRSVRVGRLDETSIPDFAVRWVGQGDWALRHGANAMVKIGAHTTGVKWKWHFHTFCTLIPHEKYYDDHPEWWPLVEGKRQRPTKPHSHSAQLCTTNPEMIEQMTRNLIAALDKEPDTDVIALSPNDGGGFCECEDCRALDEPHRDWFARYSKRLAVLNNAVARQVAKRYPRVLIKVGAYAMYLRRPLDPALAPASNQLVQMCHIYNCHNHPIQGAGCVRGKTFTPGRYFMPNTVFRRMVRDWRKVTDHLFIYEYYTLGRPTKAGLPWPLAHTIRKDMPWYHKMGVEGFYTQLSPDLFHRYGLNYYLTAKLAWDTSLDVDALMADYCLRAFGPAAEPMLAYFLRMEQAMSDADVCLSYGQEPPATWGPKVFCASVMKEAASLLRRGASVAPGGVFRRRIEFFREGFREFHRSLAKMRRAK